MTDVVVTEIKTLQIMKHLNMRGTRQNNETVHHELRDTRGDVFYHRPKP